MDLHRGYLSAKGEAVVVDWKMFKKGVFKAFAAAGFEVFEGGLRFHGGLDVDVIVSVDRSPRMSQMTIAVGFWIRTLGGKAAPARAEKTHAYFAIERLVDEDTTNRSFPRVAWMTLGRRASMRASSIY